MLTAPILFAATLLGGFLFPWWWPALAAYVAGFLFPRYAGAALASGFLGTAMAWAGMAAFLDWRNHHLLSSRVAPLFQLPSGWAVVAATGVVGGLLGGVFAWAGYALRAYVRPRAAAPEPDAPAAAAPAAETASPESGEG